MTIRQTLYCAFALATLACDQGEKSDGSVATDAVAISAAAPPAVDRQMRGQAMSKRVMNEVGAEGMDQGATVSAPLQPPTPGPDVTPAMMIRTGYATVEVEKLDPSIVKVRALATKVGGYVTNSSTAGGRDQVRAAMLELRIPAQRYDEAVTSLADIGRVESTQTNAQDVGEEFVDVTARVDNARKLEARLIDLLANRTGRLQDVLSVERELARIRTEIDQLEGRLRFLKNRVALSTLTVNLHEPQPLIGNAPGQNPIGAAVRKAWRNFVGFFATLIAAMGVLIPLAVLAGGAWWVGRGILRRRKES